MGEDSRLTRPRFVVSDTDRHGNVRWYFRRPGQPKIRLPGGPGAKDFIEAYRDAFNGVPAEHIRRRKWKSGLPTVEPGYVYFLRAGNAVKIGFSTDPASRWVQLNTGLSQRASAFVAVVGTVIDERIAHRRMAASHQHGEWFKASDEVLALMAEAARVGVKAIRPTPDSGRIPLSNDNVVSIA